MSKIIELLKKSGYSKKAQEYFIKKINVGEIKNPSSYFSYTGPCGDTMEIYLKIRGDRISEIKFQSTGCIGALTAGSALTKMIKGKTLTEAKKIDTEDILKHLGGLPEPKVHCACLAKITLRKTIKKYGDTEHEHV